MEHQLWKEIVNELRTLDKRVKRGRQTYSDEDIVRVWLWAVLHDRPVDWACRRCNWPIHLYRQALPSDSRMSRRLRSSSVKKLLIDLEQQVLAPRQLGQLVWIMDGKPMLVSRCSQDPQAGCLPKTGRGYKLHVLLSNDGQIADYRVTPIQQDEKEMARRMLLKAKIQGYVLGDANYDSNPLHTVCATKSNLQLVTPHRKSKKGNRRKDCMQTPGRLRSLAMQEAPEPLFRKNLLEQRCDVERFFGNLSGWCCGLTHLPPWVRTQPRVHRWVQGKLILNGLRKRLRERICAA